MIPSHLWYSSMQSILGGKVIYHDINPIYFSWNSNCKHCGCWKSSLSVYVIFHRMSSFFWLTMLFNIWSLFNLNFKNYYTHAIYLKNLKVLPRRHHVYLHHMLVHFILQHTLNDHFIVLYTITKSHYQSWDEFLSMVKITFFIYMWTNNTLPFFSSMVKI